MDCSCTDSANLAVGLWRKSANLEEKVDLSRDKSANLVNCSDKSSNLVADFISRLVGQIVVDCVLEETTNSG